MNVEAFGHGAVDDVEALLSLDRDTAFTRAQRPRRPKPPIQNSAYAALAGIARRRSRPLSGSIASCTAPRSSNLCAGGVNSPLRTVAHGWRCQPS